MTLTPGKKIRFGTEANHHADKEIRLKHSMGIDAQKLAPLEFDYKAYEPFNMRRGANMD